MTTPSHRLHIAEPPAAYLVRSPLVVDCSTVAGVLFQEHWWEQATQRISNRSLHAPYLLDVELANVAVKKQRQGHTPMVDDAMTRFKAMEMQLHPIEARDVITLALQYGLSAYDASYLWLAAELKAPLATFDEKLAAAAKSHLAGLT